MGKPETLIVRAADPGKPVFKPGHPLRVLDAQGNDIHVIRTEPVEVPNNAHYRKQLREGDLVEVSAAELRALEAPTSPAFDPPEPLVETAAAGGQE